MNAPLRTSASNAGLPAVNQIIKRMRKTQMKRWCYQCLRFARIMRASMPSAVTKKRLAASSSPHARLSMYEAKSSSREHRNAGFTGANQRIPYTSTRIPNQSRPGRKARAPTQSSHRSSKHSVQYPKPS